jgi:copper chaperone NosL
MKAYTSPLLFSIVLLSCSVKPEPLTVGKDACHTCKMTLMDEKFGAEIVTKKGKVYKFDDLNCMVSFFRSGYEPEENIAHRLVTDYAHPEKLTDATHAVYCRSEAIKSPMASQVAAFEKKEDMEKFNAMWQGAALSWDELVRELK